MQYTIHNTSAMLLRNGKNTTPKTSTRKIKFELDEVEHSLKQNEMREYEVNIDFDEASRLWRQNKKSIGNGCYKYVCGAVTRSNRQCRRVTRSGQRYCPAHVSHQK